MQIILEGVIYDTDNTNTLFEIDHRDNGGYTGTSYLLQAKDGSFLIYFSPCGQGEGSAYLANKEEAIDFLNGEVITEEQSEFLLDAGLLTVDKS